MQKSRFQKICRLGFSSDSGSSFTCVKFTIREDCQSIFPSEKEISVQWGRASIGSMMLLLGKIAIKGRATRFKPRGPITYP